MDWSIDLDGRKTRVATSTRYKNNKTKTSSKNIDVFVARCHWWKLLKIWVCIQCIYMDLLQSDRLIAWSIASTNVDGRKTRIAAYAFGKSKT